MSAALPLNVLHVLSDQHLATCLGAAGHPQALMPNLDRLAASGVRFTNAYCQNPICTPSRVSVLSGQYCHNHGYFGLSGPAPARLPSFLQHFRAHGYRTAGIGKLHLPNDPQDWIADHVDLYAECYDYKQRERSRQQSRYYDFLRAQGLSSADDDSIALGDLPGQQQHEARPSRLSFDQCVEGWIVSTAKQFIDDASAAQQPFCMQVSFPRPHQCYAPDQRFWEMYPEDLELPPTLNQDPAGRPPHFQQTFAKYRRQEGSYEPRGFEHLARRVWRGYLACITQVDYALGLLLDHLENTGLAQRTIVVYHSDHGAYSGTHGIPEKAPGICSEAVCRVPMIWRVPELASSGAVCEQLVENIDVASTLPALCGLEPMDSTDGVDLAPLLRGADQPVRNAAFTENPWSKAVRWEHWRFVHYQPEMFGGQDVGELYDLAADPNEARNLYHDPAHQPQVQHARMLLLQWLIRSQRVVTHWSPMGMPSDHGPRYPLAGDGKESYGPGPLATAQAGRLTYL